MFGTGHFGTYIEGIGIWVIETLGLLIFHLDFLRPDSPVEVVFSCRKKKGAVISLPTQARCEDTVALGDFGQWMIKHVDPWFAWVRQLGVGITRMEDIVLVTGAHRTRSWTNVAFPGGQVDAQVSFGANVATRGDTVTINWKFSQECSRGAVMNCGPSGEVRHSLLVCKRVLISKFYLL